MLDQLVVMRLPRPNGSHPYRLVVQLVSLVAAIRRINCGVHRCLWRLSQTDARYAALAGTDLPELRLQRADVQQHRQYKNNADIGMTETSLSRTHKQT